MMRKKVGITIGVLAAMAALIILAVVWRTKPTSDITIGWVGPLSGQYASYGKMVKTGVEIAVEEINSNGGVNGRRIVVVYEDDQLDPKKGVAAFNKLVSVDGVPLVIQAAGSNVMLAQAPIAQRRKVVLISPTCTNPKISEAGEYVFRIAPSDTYQGKIIAEIAFADLGARSAAVLYINNDYGVGLKDIFLRDYGEMGGEVKLSEGFAPETKDFRTVLGKIKEAAPSIVFLSSLYQEAALIVKQARELGISFQFIGGDGCFAPELIERAGDAAEGMVVINMHWDPQSADPHVRNFVERVKAKAGRDPEVYAALGYDCLRVVADAIGRGGSSSDGIRTALSKTTALPGLTGPTTFDGNGDVQKAFDTFRIEAAEFRKQE
jgi:branched-chain amino acid transport system substrate-binding protein